GGAEEGDRREGERREDERQGAQAIHRASPNWRTVDRRASRQRERPFRLLRPRFCAGRVDERPTSPNAPPPDDGAADGREGVDGRSFVDGWDGRWRGVGAVAGRVDGWPPPLVPPPRLAWPRLLSSRPPPRSLPENAGAVDVAGIVEGRPAEPRSGARAPWFA